MPAVMDEFAVGSALRWRARGAGRGVVAVTTSSHAMGGSRGVESCRSCSWGLHGGVGP